jgi:hypothetical protein
MLAVTIKTQKTPTESVELATDIIENQFDAFTKKTLRQVNSEIRFE